MNLTQPEKTELELEDEELNLELIDKKSLRSNQFDNSNKKWQDLNLSEEMIRGLVDCKQFQPSQIQLKSIPLIIDTNQHLIAQARNGSGKTISFLVGSISKIDLKVQSLQVLIIAPNRELMNQIYQVCFEAVKQIDGLQIAKVTDLKDNVQLKTAQLVVSSPGVAVKAFKKQALSLDAVKLIVFDEADAVLGEEHSDHCLKLVDMMKEKNSQFVAFSATVTDNLLQFFDSNFTNNQNKITVSINELSLDGIKHLCIQVGKDEKINVLDTMQKAMTVGQCIIFVNTKKFCQTIKSHLEKLGRSCSVLTGQLDKSERDKVIKEFENGSSKVLVTTNIIARGQDEKKVNLIINFDLPMKVGQNTIDEQTQLHRVGRTGRFGRLGVAVNIMASDEDVAKVQEISDKLNIEMDSFDNNDIDKIIDQLEKVEMNNAEDLI